MGARQASGIFISYRRQDTAWPARQIYDVIAREFRADHVFKDVDTIQPGQDFLRVMRDALSSSDVLLVLIGPNWLDARDRYNRRRLDDPDDYVRVEIRGALERNISVIPILVDDTSMPSPEDLPPDLRPLTHRQAISISPVAVDTKRLVRTIKEARSGGRGPVRLGVLLAVPAVVAILLAFVLVRNLVGSAAVSPHAAPMSSPLVRDLTPTPAHGGLAPTPPTAASTSPPPVATNSSTALAWPASTAISNDELVVSIKRNGNTDLYVVSVDGSSRSHRLTSSEDVDTSPNLSPDRRTVIYRRYAGTDQSTSTLRVVAVDGTGDRPLFSKNLGQCRQGIYRPGWNPVRPDELAVFCDAPGGGIAAYLVRTDGEVIRPLDLPGLVSGDLTFSPDGDHLAFWSATGGQTTKEVNGGSIWILDLATNELRRITQSPDGSDADVSWSPTGDTLAFRRRFDGGKGGNFNLMSISADGGNLQTLADDLADEGSPSFSPDGQQIAYRSIQRIAGQPLVQHVWILDLQSHYSHPLWSKSDQDNSYEQGRPAWVSR